MLMRFFLKNVLHFIIFTNCIPIVFGQVYSCHFNDTSKCFLNFQYQNSKLIIEKKFSSKENISIYLKPLLIDMDQDCIPDFVTVDINFDKILIIDSNNGQTKWQIATPRIQWFAGSLVSTDVDADGSPDIFILTEGFGSNPGNLKSKIICYNSFGQIKWISDKRVDLNIIDEKMGCLALADFNQDGIPEIYIRNKIFNAQTGVQLAEGGNNGIGMKQNSNYNPFPITIAAQLDNDTTDLELAAGYTIYKVNLTNLNGMSGNTMLPINIQINNSYLDGYTSIADINQDKKLDVIVSYPGLTNEALVYAYTLSNGIPTLIAQASPPGTIDYIGPALISDIGPLSKPSIIFNRASSMYAYEYDGTQTFNLKWVLPTTDSSGTTGLTSFDFNNDGIQEIVHRDETSLNIIDGSIIPPQIIASYPCLSGTWNETPIVGDFKNLGESNICVACGIVPDDNIGKLTIFGPPDSLPGWAPARGIWNQYNYHVLNINDDLTVPRVQKNNATYKNGKYNNFYVQESLVDSNGYYKRPAASLFGMMDCIQYDPLTDLYSVDFSLFNKKNASHAADSGLSVAFYNGNPELGAPLLGIYHTGQSLAAGDSLLNLVFRFSASGLKHLFMVINTQRNASGSFNDADFILNECDYTDNFFSTLELPSIIKTDTFICQNSSFRFFDTTLTVPGFHFHSFTNSKGCDSIVHILILKLRDTSQTLIQVFACDSLIWNGMHLDSSGLYSHVLSNQFGCDSSLILDLQLMHSSSSSLTATACDSFYWNQQFYLNSGQFVVATTNSVGCDSMAVLNLIIHQADTSFSTQTACDSFFWNGSWLYKTGIYSFNSFNQFNCDSLAVLDLQIDSVIHSFQSIQSCDSLIWNNTLYKASGQYQYNTLSTLGCDSVAHLNLQLNHSNQSHLRVTACDSFLWNGLFYTQDGLYSKLTQNAAGCDSLAFLDLTIHVATQSLDSITSCNSYFWNDSSYHQSGLYTFKSQNVYGCDSLAMLQLVILASDSTIFTKTVCDSLIWNGSTLQASGDYTFTTKNKLGCDSTIFLKLSVNHASRSDLSFSVCDSLLINGQILRNSGNYLFKLLNAQACDSLVSVQLHILSDFHSDTVEVCDSLVWPVNGNVYTQSGIYQQHFINQYACDSSFRLNLLIHPSFIHIDSVKSCDPFLWLPKQQQLSSSGDYVASFQSVAGCDSIIKLHLDILPDFEFTDSVYTQDVFTWKVNQQRYSASGIYRQNFLSSLGCDSIHWLVLTINKDLQIYYPNVINTSSQQNDHFNLFVFGQQAIIDDLSIFDRWGNLIWQTIQLVPNDTQQGWNGKSNEQFVLPGVYVWNARIKLQDGSIILKSGDLTVVR